jgi:hypothetical protein
MRESTSEMSLIVAELEPRMPRNKITETEAGQSRVKTYPTWSSARVAGGEEKVCKMRD